MAKLCTKCACPTRNLKYCSACVAEIREEKRAQKAKELRELVRKREAERKKNYLVVDLYLTEFKEDGISRKYMTKRNILRLAEEALKTTQPPNSLVDLLIKDLTE